jgi:hypothetical protein
MTDEIIRKLTAELNPPGINTEAKVVYLMAGLRKLIERDQLGEKFSVLKFHCDWVLHSKLEGTAAKEILAMFDKAEGLMHNTPYEKLPASLRRKIDNISKMESFEEEMSSCFAHYNLPAIMHAGADGWTHFLHLYTQVVQDIPLSVAVPTAKKKPTSSKPVQTAFQHVSSLVVTCELAKETIKYEGGEEMLYKIWWTIKPTKDEPKSFFIMNSFPL